MNNGLKIRAALFLGQFEPARDGNYTQPMSLVADKHIKAFADYIAALPDGEVPGYVCDKHERASMVEGAECSECYREKVTEREYLGEKAPKTPECSRAGSLSTEHPDYQNALAYARKQGCEGDVFLVGGKYPYWQCSINGQPYNFCVKGSRS